MPIKFMPRMLRCKKSDAAQHVCDLKKGSESHLPRLPPNAELTARFKRRLQKILLVSANHPFTRLFLRSKAVIAFEKRRHGISPYWWIIHPCSSFRFVWDVTMAFVYLFMFIMIPHTISFHRLSKKGLAYDFSHDRFKILMPGYIMCLIDIFLNFITGFISPDGHEIFIDPMIIIKNLAEMDIIYIYINIKAILLSLMILFYFHVTKNWDKVEKALVKVARIPLVGFNDLTEKVDYLE